MPHGFDKNATVCGERGAFTPDARRSFTLPSRYYTDGEIFEAENERIFTRSWIYAGHVTDLPDPGCYVADEVAGEPIILIRGKDGALRAFYNVCQHRGHVLAEGSGRFESAIVCPYHAWSYGFDGSLKAARFTKSVSGFQVEDFSLPRLRVATVAGLIFVNLDPNAPRDSDELDHFGETLLDALPELARFQAVKRYQFDIAANWKVLVDNFSEGYHIPCAHPQLARLYNTDGGEALVQSRFAFYRKTAKAGFEPLKTSGDEPYLSWWFWPNLCLLRLPGAPHLMVLRMDPKEAGRSIERVDIYAPDEEEHKNLRVVSELFAKMFNKEDIAIAESVQRGLACRGYDQGRYVVDKDDSWFSESALHRFHQLVVATLDRE